MCCEDTKIYKDLNLCRDLLAHSFVAWHQKKVLPPILIRCHNGTSSGMISTHQPSLRGIMLSIKRLLMVWLPWFPSVSWIYWDINLVPWYKKDEKQKKRIRLSKSLRPLQVFSRQFAGEMRLRLGASPSSRGEKPGTSFGQYTWWSLIWSQRHMCCLLVASLHAWRGAQVFSYGECHHWQVFLPS